MEDNVLNIYIFFEQEFFILVILLHNIIMFLNAYPVTYVFCRKIVLK